MPVLWSFFYVPGGRAVLPSSVVMNVIPAQVAGVEQIAVASLPQREYDGLPHPTILAACALLGIDEVYAVGGAQAIAMARVRLGRWGDELPGPVDMVTGPGNIYVAAAKRLLKGQVGIDSEAGPTEIAILADDSADAAYVAADLVSQAEHDPLAAAVLVSDSPALIEAVDLELEKRVAATKHRGADRLQALEGRQSALILVDDLEAGLAVVDGYAAEHLRSRPRTPGCWPAGCATPAPSSSARTPRSRSATTAPVEPRAAPPAATCPLQLGARRCRASRASTSPSTTSPRWPRSPGTGDPRQRRDLARARRGRGWRAVGFFPQPEPAPEAGVSEPESAFEPRRPSHPAVLEAGGRPPRRPAPAKDEPLENPAATTAARGHPVTWRRPRRSGTICGA